MWSGGCGGVGVILIPDLNHLPMATSSHLVAEEKKVKN